MRIGLVTNMMDTNTGGIGRYTSELVKKLLILDKKNTYYLIHTKNKTYDFQGNYEEIKLPLFSTIPRKLFTGAWYFEKICRDYKLDILHDLGQISPFFWKSETKRILTVYDLSPVLFMDKFSVISKLTTKLYPFAYHYADKIITISENSKKDLIRLYNIPEEKIIVTYPGINNQFKKIKDMEALEHIQNKYHLPKKFILFVGTIEPRKNLENLIKVYAMYPNRNDIKLVIVGKKGWKYKPFFQTLENLDLGNDVILLGFVDNDDLPYIYNLAKIFVYPSYYEGFGLPPLEAISCGCPVITSNTSSLPEVVGKAGLIINPYSLKNELIPALHKILYNSDYRKKLTKNGFLQAKKFNWAKTAKETLKLYNTIFSK